MKEIHIRTLTGIFFIVVVIGSVLWHPLAFFVVFAVFNYLGLAEFLKLSSVNDGIRHNLMYFVAGMLIYALLALLGLHYLDLRYGLLLLAVFFLPFVAELFRTENILRERLGAWFTGFFYVSVPFGLMNGLFYTGFFGSESFAEALGFSAQEARTDLLIGLFVIIWTSDVFAYLVGSWLGRHRLFERISPKKSWEGSIGGLLFALLAAFLLSLVFHELNTLQWMGFALIAVLTGSLGDLVESMLKRRASLKDSGNLLPGHGGVLDRFDAALFATPFLFVYVNLINT